MKTCPDCGRKLHVMGEGRVLERCMDSGGHTCSAVKFAIRTDRARVVAGIQKMRDETLALTAEEYLAGTDCVFRETLRIVEDK